MVTRVGVRWFGPASWATVQDAGVQGTVAAVRGRLEMLAAVVANGGALSLAWPAIESCVGVDVVSSQVNCTYADAMMAPGGTTRFWNRSPTTWVTAPSSVISRSVLPRFTEVGDSSASSSPPAMASSKEPLGGACFTAP